MGAGSFLDSYAQVRIESAYGTQVTSAAKKFPLKSLALIPELDTFQSEMTVGAAGASAIFNGAIRDKGSLAAELTYNGLDWLYYLVMGAKAVTGDGTATAYTKTFTPSSTMPSATIEECLGNIPVNKVYTHLGVKCNAIEIAFDAAQGIGQFSAELQAKQEKGTAGGDTPTSSGLTTITAQPIQLAAEATIWNPGTSNGSTPDTRYCVTSGRIRIDRQLGPGIVCLGSVNPKEPKPTKTMIVTAELDVLFDDDQLYEDFKAKGAATAFRLKWVGDLTGIGTDHYLTDFRINRARITKALPGIDAGAEAITAKVSILGYGSGGTAMTSEPCAIQTVNLESGAYLA